MLKEVEAINNIVYQAVLHGGDSGGSYESNETDLTDVLYEWINLKGLTHKCGVRTIMTSNGRIPQIIEL